MKPSFRLLVIFLVSISLRGHAQKLKVACIGNSVTAGYLLNQPEKNAYPSQLQNLLGDSYKVDNFGHSGATLLKKGHNPYYKTKEFTDALTFRPDIAVIALGLNDTDPRNWPNYNGEFSADYQWLMDTLKAVSPKIKIYLCRLSPIFSGHPRFKSGTRDWYWEIQDKIVQLAAENQLEVIDLHEALGNRPDLFADNLHPDVTGAGIIAKTVFEHLTGNYGGFRIDQLFADHMVLQRDRPIAVFGDADVSDKIEVEFNHIRLKTAPDANGKWKVLFPAMKFGGPYSLKISSKFKKVIINDVLIGDVWLCSGQSNMAFPLKSSLTGKATMNSLDGNLPIRLLKFNALAETDNIAWGGATLDSINALKYFSGNWAKPEPATVADFSAVAYYFGEKIVRDERVPVGLIQMAVGGSTLESWMDRKTLEGNDLLVDLVNGWRKSDFIQDWVRGRAEVNLKNALNPKQRHPYEPAYNFEAGIATLTSFAVKGVIWCQGESNAHNVALFNQEFPLLVQSWRKKWNSNLPFYYVQLSSLDRPSWPYFRDAQRKMQSLIPNVAMAVTSDLGDSLNVHPIRKKEVGERLAKLALQHTYHKNILSSGPVAVKAAIAENSLVVTFSQARQLKAAGGVALKGFEIEDKKGNRLKPNATIAGNKVYLALPANFKPRLVLYGWQPFTRANLINEAGLPASTFSMPLN
ncbi:GDSL-type esterase/lipase family protein [Pedobacter endophyticus]|uniref:Sialate O-acetylesterase n=1 Tax=Pedobacter endophyticus TaxID=2789740 RepID=A0A7S9L148_9SPHI|nr:GDSL-type esterase/lipase family protein [Pedobacter endophyticus]QPH40561.1 sialate O-acetylesterase [Pedobacter endophyticus]